MINIDQLKHDYYLPVLKHINSLQQTDSLGKILGSDKGWYYYVLPNEIQFETQKVKKYFKRVYSISNTIEIKEILQKCFYLIYNKQIDVKY